MKYLSRKSQISMQSHPEIIPRLKELVAILAGEELKILNKELTYGHVINGLILQLLDHHPQEEQLKRVRAAVARLEDWMLERSSAKPLRGIGTATTLPKSESKDKMPRGSAH